MKNRNGFYIVFEGVVGTGKTTQSKKLTEFLKRKFPQKEVIWTYEPGGTEIAKAIRKVVQGTSFSEEMEPICEAYLYAAARAQSLRKLTKPVLERGGIVLSDRSFLTSLAYQGVGRGLKWETVMEINRIALANLEPDLIIYLDLELRMGLARTFDKQGDKFESEELKFFERVDRGYKKLSRAPLFSEKWLTVSAVGEIENVFHKVLQKITRP